MLLAPVLSQRTRKGRSTQNQIHWPLDGPGHDSLRTSPLKPQNRLSRPPTCRESQVSKIARPGAPAGPISYPGLLRSVRPLLPGWVFLSLMN